jgi:hypothetical protein
MFQFLSNVSIPRVVSYCAMYVPLEIIYTNIIRYKDF